MTDIGKPERVTQDRVIALFCDELRYTYLGDRTDYDGNSNIEEGLLTAYLTRCGYTPAQISVALHRLRTEADNHGRTLYGNNREVYSLLRYGVQVNVAAGEHLNDPAFFDTMSAQLQEIIELRKAKAIEYEEYLQKIAELVKRVEAGQADDTPEQLKVSPALRALYNNLGAAKGHYEGELPGDGSATYGALGDPKLALASYLHDTVKRVRHDGWRGVETRERVIKQALYDILQDVDAVERIFLIVKAQGEY